MTVYKPDYTVRELEMRFQFEEECIRMGKPIRGREFMAALRERLAESRDGMREA
ncbi:MAG: hypothetical protein K2P73_11710 [Lachnospiraceae bacterium]|nr:hypothetical protein [Lachnospiraceae bacterium]